MKSLLLPIILLISSGPLHAQDLHSFVVAFQPGTFHSCLEQVRQITAPDPRVVEQDLYEIFDAAIFELPVTAARQIQSLDCVSEIRPAGTFNASCDDLLD